MSDAQKDDVNNVFAGWKNAGNLDYVCCWYKKGADLMKGQNQGCACIDKFCYTGRKRALLWKPLFEADAHIDFAHRTFRWDSEAKSKAHVHCVIVGYSCAPSDKPRYIFTAGRAQSARNINAYLLDADDIFVESRSKPICDVPEIGIGCQPIDDGNYCLHVKK